MIKEQWYEQIDDPDGGLSFRWPNSDSEKKFNLNEFIMKPVFVARPRKSYFSIEEVNLHLGICCSSWGLIDVDNMKTFEDTKCSFE